MLFIIGLCLIVGGSAGIIWILFWYLLNASSQVGTKISKKIGTDNEYTNDYLATSRKFSKELMERLIRRIAVVVVGLVIYFFAK